MADPDKINSFSGGLNEDTGAPYIPKNEWTHARNAISNSATGDVGLIGAEPANRHLVNAPYRIIGFVYIYDDKWAVFSTLNGPCELGLFHDFTGQYETIVNDIGFNWSIDNLITGEARMNFDCTWSVYFSDNHRNPDRVININNVPYKGTFGTDTNGCQTFTLLNPLQLDIDQIKLNRPVKMPCISLVKGSGGGSLLNGTYYVTIAYTVNGQKVSNYANLSNAVSLFSHNNLAGTLNVELTDLDDSYDQYELVVISVVNEQPVARMLGLFGTNQHHISIDIISNELPVVPIRYLPVINPLMESSNMITSLDNRLIRVGPKSKFDFNYQQIANQIDLHWVSVEYPANYYGQGGVNPSFLRDENYAASIRWVYDDGDRSASFHIPGRAPLANEQDVMFGIFSGTYLFENANTATLTSTSIVALPDGGYQVSEGEMGYYETDNLYPINKPAVWGNLCGKKIRHHKFPEVTHSSGTSLYADTGLSPIVGPVIRVMGVKAYNIKPPVDNQNNLIKNIVGYEILIGSRVGNKTIIAKGIINNTFTYDLTNGSNKKGVYQNYPYNSLDDDPFISTTETGTQAMTGVITALNPNPGASAQNSAVRKDLVTFHSPDTTFRRPFLSAEELKLDGIFTGAPVLRFIEPDKHPKHKMPTNLAFFIAALVGIGLGVTKLIGSRSSSVSSMLPTGGSGATLLGVGLVVGAALLASNNIDDDDSINNVKDDSGDIVEANDPGQVEAKEQAARKNTSTGASLTGAFTGGGKESHSNGGIGKAIGKTLRGVAMGGAALFVQFWSEGVDTTLQTILNLSQWQQYALQQISHCFYSDFVVPPALLIGSGTNITTSSRRYLIQTAKYLGQSFQEFDNDFQINNLYRSSTVAIRTAGDMASPFDETAAAVDISKQSLSTISQFFTGASNIHKNPTHLFVKTFASSFYAALKIRLRNQYGQVHNIKQLPPSCTQYVTVDFNNPSLNVYESPVIFGGDTYITRYTEKNTMFFFDDWLYNQFEGQEFNYFKNRMLQFPSYWVNTEKFDVGDFIKGWHQQMGGTVTAVTGNLSGNTQPQLNKADPWLPTGFRALDRKIGIQDGFVNTPGEKISYFVVKNGYFYLFVSGVRDFYVESEVNLAYRDWEEPIQKRHYDNDLFVNMPGMFKADPDVIKADNFYKYDYSLSLSKSFVNFASWGAFQPSYYDPELAETCYVHHPKRIVYSLPQEIEQIRDCWRIFLVNNYRDFKSNVTTVKSINQTGAIIVFESDAPLMIQGNETLTLSSTAITIGDGSFLARAAQNITNADRPYQVGASKDARSVVNTPAGLFWMSPDQSKIFTVNQGLMDIAMPEMTVWFSKYMPYRLLEDFPNFNNIGNPVNGIACQTIYDNTGDIIYFTKRDFKFKSQNLLSGWTAVYNPDGLTIIPMGGGGGDTGGGGGVGGGGGGAVVAPPFGHFGIYDNFQTLLYVFELGDPLFFDDVSWTISYDPSSKKWISYHDWHPDLVMPSKVTFNTIKANGIWRHNERCDLHCNFYGIDYPWEIEYEHNTGIQVNTLRSIEYYMEAYKYASNCYDRYLLLDENFDEAVIYNNEQCSGTLKLKLVPFDDPFAGLNYPKINIGNANTEIAFYRVENKYRVNGFVDLTDDRGQFSNARRMLWNTADNGYIRTVNLVNLNHQKDPFQQKRFRGYTTYVFLKKNIVGSTKFLMLFAVNKTLESKR